MSKKKVENIIVFILVIVLLVTMWLWVKNLRDGLPYEDFCCPKCGYQMLYRLDNPMRPNETIYKCMNCKSEMSVSEDVPSKDEYNDSE